MIGYLSAVQFPNNLWQIWVFIVGLRVAPGKRTVTNEWRGTHLSHLQLYGYLNNLVQQCTVPAISYKKSKSLPDHSPIYHYPIPWDKWFHLCATQSQRCDSSCRRSSCQMSMNNKFSTVRSHLSPWISTWKIIYISCFLHIRMYIAVPIFS